jgi:putative FmdB family regulatory protein
VPLYEFDCRSCGARFEEIVPAGCTAPCPACGEERVSRVFSQIAAPGVPVGPPSRKAAAESNARRREREAQRKEHFVAERKRKRGEGPPGG